MIVNSSGIGSGREARITGHASTFLIGTDLSAEPGSCPQRTVAHVAASSKGNLLLTFVNLLASDYFRVRGP